MNILYLPCHSINEYEDCKLLTDLGHDVLSQGSYSTPDKPGDAVARPPIPNMKRHDELISLLPKAWYEVLNPELVKWADLIWVLGIQGWIPPNWEQIKKKHVVFRSIGQSIPDTERLLARYRPEGLKIVRYSPHEVHIPGFCGFDATIRFYKDKDVYKDWNGGKKEVITIVQDMMHRDAACKFNLFEKTTRGLPRHLYGRGNKPIQPWITGEISFAEMRQQMRDNRVFFYTCTQPAQYTMAFQEAWMTGMPVVAIGKQLASYPVEVPDLIENGVNGFTSNSTGQLRSYCKQLLENDELATIVSRNARASAIKLFDYEPIKNQWREFLNGL